MASTELPGKTHFIISTGATLVKLIRDDNGNEIARQIYTTTEPMLAFIDKEMIPVKEGIYYKIPQND